MVNLATNWTAEIDVILVVVVVVVTVVIAVVVVTVAIAVDADGLRNAPGLGLELGRVLGLRSQLVWRVVQKHEA